MKTIAIGELLTPAQCEDVRQILLTETDPIAVTRKLRDYFVPLRDQLEAKGMLPEYLAYVLPFTLQATVDAHKN